MSEFPLLICHHLKQCITNTDTSYSLNVNPNIVLFLLITCAITWLVVLIFFLKCTLWPKAYAPGFNPMTMLFIGKDDPRHPLQKQEHLAKTSVTCNYQCYYHLLQLYWFLLILLLSLSLPAALRWYPFYMTLRYQHHLNLHIALYQRGSLHLMPKLSYWLLITCANVL